MADKKNESLKASGDEVVEGETNLGAIVVNGLVIGFYWIYATLAIKFYGAAFGKFNTFQVCHYFIYTDYKVLNTY